MRHRVEEARWSARRARLETYWTALKIAALLMLAMGIVASGLYGGRVADAVATVLSLLD